MSVKQFITKTTVQAFLASLVTVVASAGFLLDRIDGPQFMVLVVLAFGWAFKAPSGNSPS